MPPTFGVAEEGVSSHCRKFSLENLEKFMFAIFTFFAVATADEIFIPRLAQNENESMQISTTKENSESSLIPVGQPTDTRDTAHRAFSDVQFTCQDYEAR